MEYKSITNAYISRIKLLGRAYKAKEGFAFGWSYAGISFRFNGTGFIIGFSDFSDEQPCYIRVYVDGHSARYGISDGKETVIIEGLKEKIHTVTVIRITEGMGVLTVKEILLAGTEPRLSRKPSAKKIKTEFIGDSITCGYGVAAPSSVPGFSTFEEDCTLSYAYEAADLLDADISFTGASGKGIVANCLGDRKDMTLRQGFIWKNRRGDKWNFKKYTPDIIVVNAGTNDAWGGISDAEWIEYAEIFIKEIRCAYPEKPILWCYGIMDTTKENAVKTVTEITNKEIGNVYCLFVDNMSLHPGETGGGGHPNTNTSHRVAPILASTIKDILNK